ncbi:MAG: hypothetical protein Q7U57_03045 [Methylovulum sp.]|nr:hypothetical protein [Methylovulum sp.]
MKTHIVSTAIMLAVCSLYSGLNRAQGDSGGGYHDGGHGQGGSHFRGGDIHSGEWGYRGGYRSYPRFGIYLGAPYYAYPYFRHPYYRQIYQTPYYYPPSVVTIPITPPVYIQQTPPAIQQYPSGYWYYCNRLKGYYPYIKQCPGGWQQVEPTPPAPR